ncbi:18309_t:CDS:2 [Racocetra fulgida]|uniref:18309_t:CDS:1 n=1 Tax=Racocetra fulgida TaxID=60492 RepID=A0A9N8YSV9_9GLOM|nr:18309_t:CDS:2 [Racocetra fulgida]
MDSEDIIDSDILDSNEDFITPPKNFGTHWTGFLHSKQLKNDKARRYNAKCTYCDQIFEARKEAMTNHIVNICRKIPAENRIIYSRIIKEKSEQVTKVSTHKAVLMTDYFDKAIIHRHFLENEQFTIVLRYIVDAIAKLESNNTTLGDIFAKLLVIYKKLRSSEFEDFDYGLIDHAKDIVNFRAKEFDEPIYYLAFFLNPKFRKAAVSKKLTFDNMVVYALTFAQIWKFTYEQAKQISQKLLDYYNNDPPFNLTVLEPRLYWKKISHQAGALKVLALKIFAIRPHSAEVERLFSRMGMAKTKIRNQLSTSTLKMISQIKLTLSIEVSKKNLKEKLVTREKQDNDNLDDYDTLFSLDLIDLINDEDNELEFNNIQEIDLEPIRNNSELFMEDHLNCADKLITFTPGDV